MDLSYTLVQGWFKADSLSDGLKGLEPQQRLILLSDGSLTLELVLLFGAKGAVEVRRNALSTLDKETSSYLEEVPGKEAIERVVWLTLENKRLVFAKTLIPLDRIDRALKKTLEKKSSEPLGRVLNSQKIAFIKERLELAPVMSAAAASDLGMDKDSLLLARRYVLFNREEGAGRWIIKAAVTEIFNPAIMPCGHLIPGSPLQ
ncbi:MAG: chorismate lyase [Deltaproteobacteria bacterium]|nr:chorismate lyase [Deltaproteobacteria bacterium]